MALRPFHEDVELTVRQDGEVIASETVGGAQEIDIDIDQVTEQVIVAENFRDTWGNGTTENHREEITIDEALRPVEMAIFRASWSNTDPDDPTEEVRMTTEDNDTYREDYVDLPRVSDEGLSHLTDEFEGLRGSSRVMYRGEHFEGKIERASINSGRNRHTNSDSYLRNPGIWVFTEFVTNEMDVEID